MKDSPADRRSPLGLSAGERTLRFHDRVVEVLRTRHYSRRTEEAYLYRIRCFLALHNGAHPHEMAEMDSQPFADLLGSRHKRVSVHAEPDSGGGAVPFRAPAGTAAGPYRRSGAGPQADATAGRAGSRRGPGNLGRTGWCPALGMQAPRRFGAETGRRARAARQGSRLRP